MRTPDGAPREWRPQAGRDPHLRGCSNREVGGPLALIQEVPPQGLTTTCNTQSGSYGTQTRDDAPQPAPPQPRACAHPSLRWGSWAGRGLGRLWSRLPPCFIQILLILEGQFRCPPACSVPRMPAESDTPLLSPLPYRGSGAFRGSPCPASY